LASAGQQGRVFLSGHPAEHGKQRDLKKMPIGKVANYFEERGFGFIAPDDGSAHVFVHVSHIANADVLKKDQGVSFELATDARTGKPRADRVRVI
jgi:CspA family cold shock protein